MSRFTRVTVIIFGCLAFGVAALLSTRHVHESAAICIEVGLFFCATSSIADFASQNPQAKPSDGARQPTPIQEL
jgi:hypothetical protein